MPEFDFNFWWYSHKETIYGYFCTGVILFFIAFVIYKCNTIPPPPPSKNETHCAQFVYFNSSTHKIDTTYSPILTYNDSIVNITTPTGKVWWAKDFVVREDILVDETPASDVTISDGTRYKIIPLDSGSCQRKAIMDSIRSTYPGENDNDN